jgi:hypothetical protein
MQRYKPRIEPGLSPWQPEILQIMEKIGCNPLDFDDSSDEESQSELKDSDEKDQEFKQGELVHCNPVISVLRQ